eukprot:TRINITY_DN1165_c0_g1_i10.p1 TRINITY_DN1165_c0_g1~~TRINITY_DN1165_c0_g1_i10.p1  ORF type:complete len:379 (+),score=130.40 TRINITY_DN1165_c0_g1_i10:543-1679(+)
MSEGERRERDSFRKTNQYGEERQIRERFFASTGKMLPKDLLPLARMPGLVNVIRSRPEDVEGIQFEDLHREDKELASEVRMVLLGLDSPQYGPWSSEDEEGEQEDEGETSQSPMDTANDELEQTRMELDVLRHELSSAKQQMEEMGKQGMEQGQSRDFWEQTYRKTISDLLEENSELAEKAQLLDVYKLQLDEYKQELDRRIQEFHDTTPQLNAQREIVRKQKMELDDLHQALATREDHQNALKSELQAMNLQLTEYKRMLDDQTLEINRLNASEHDADKIAMRNITVNDHVKLLYDDEKKAYFAETWPNDTSQPVYLVDDYGTGQSNLETKPVRSGTVVMVEMSNDSDDETEDTLIADEGSILPTGTKYYRILVEWD